MNFITLCVGLSFLVLSVLKYIGYAPKINSEILLCFAAATFLFAIGSIFNDFATYRKDNSRSKNSGAEPFTFVAKIFSFMGIFVAVCLPLIFARFSDVFERMKIDSDLIVLINLTLVLLSISIKSRIPVKVRTIVQAVQTAENPATPAVELAAATVEEKPLKKETKESRKKTVQTGE